MNKNLTTILLGFGLICVSTTAFGQFYLTGASVFSANSSGGYAALDTWVTEPDTRFFKVWLQDSGGNFLNGPALAQSRPNALIPEGSSSYKAFLSPGADAPYFGMNLFFNNGSTPGISVFAPLRTSTASTPFYANGASITLDQTGFNGIHGSGSLTFQSGNYIVTLTDFYLAKPSVYNLDLVDQMNTGANGEKDYVAGMTLFVQTVPEPAISTLLVCGLIFLSGRKLARK